MLWPSRNTPAPPSARNAAVLSSRSIPGTPGSTTARASDSIGSSGAVVVVVELVVDVVDEVLVDVVDEVVVDVVTDGAVLVGIGGSVVDVVVVGGVEGAGSGV
jgi:hypothetical protein